MGYPSPRQTRSEPGFAGFRSEGYDYRCLGNGSTMSGMSGYGATPNLATTAGLFLLRSLATLGFWSLFPTSKKKSSSQKTLVTLLKI